MSLATGEYLGPYEIVGLLGKGGMGEVYRAWDTRLKRTVAIKTLPQGNVSDPSRQERFIRKTRATSALNHPNIVTIYDVASDRGLDSSLWSMWTAGLLTTS